MESECRVRVRIPAHNIPFLCGVFSLVEVTMPTCANSSELIVGNRGRGIMRRGLFEGKGSEKTSEDRKTAK